MSHIITYSVPPDIFRDFPTYRCGIVVAHGIQNGKSDPTLASLLYDAQDEARRVFNIETLSEDPHIKPWREAFRRFGAKPNEFRPSVEALLRRVLKGQLLKPISSLVDIGTVASLKYGVPIGGHALDHVRDDIALRHATGDEQFVPFGSGGGTESPVPGEVIFTEGQTVLTRRWVWRQSTRTILADSTAHVVFNVDLLMEASDAELLQMCEYVASLLVTHCGGKAYHDVLSAAHPAVQLSINGA